MTVNIDPISSLAFSISANKGVYALLLGSGVSRSSKIPSGWEITIDLVRQVAAMKEETCEPDPAAWYLTTFGKEPDYSELLDVLCQSPAERHQLVRSYIEPTDDERSEGDKQPTSAHRAIANFVKDGFVRVILTTNFDKLTEIALQDVGVVPTVLSTVDHIAGALPLVHTACTVIKIHGDYLDTRIRNTSSELAAYPDEFVALLDRIFDEYGLIVCGWSAEWDEALRNALSRSPYRRFSTYWAGHGNLGDSAKDLIHRRSAHFIPIGGADTFFSKLAQLVLILEAFSQPHPLSTAAAVASVKKYLSDDKYTIQLNDLISEETDRVFSNTRGVNFGTNIPNVTSEILGARVQTYEAVSTTLIEMAMVAGYWTKPAQMRPWLRSVAKLYCRENVGGFTTLIGFQRYPACLIMYAFGLGAIAADNLDVLGELFSINIVQEDRDNMLSIAALHPIRMFENGTRDTKLLPGKELYHLPLSSWIEDFYCSLGEKLFQNGKAYRAGFDKLEFLWTLAFAYSIRNSTGHYWVPAGNYIFRGGSCDQLVKEVRRSLLDDGENSPYVKSRIFGTTVKDCEEILFKVEPELIEWMRTR